MTPLRPAVPRPSGSLRNPLPWAAGLLLLACVLAYASSLRGVFIYDDADSIQSNPAIRSLWPPLGFLHTRAGLTLSGRPVLALSMALNYAVSGQNPWSYHVVNLAVHAAAALALLGIVRRTGRSLGLSAPDALLMGTACALFWGLHPLQTEAVTYVVQRAESLAGLLALLTLYAFIRAVEAGSPPRPHIGWTCLAVGCCLLGVGTKETVGPVPLLVLLYDRTFLAGSFRSALRLRWRQHAALAACWIPLLLLIASGGWNRSGAVGLGVPVKPWAYWLTQPEAIVRYLRLALWPAPLVFEYGTFWRTWAQAWPYALPVVLLLGFTGWALVRRPAAGFVAAWFWINLAPTSLMPGTKQMIVEHRMYLALASLGVLAVVTLHRLWGRAGLLALCGWSLVLGAVTASRNAQYASEIGLWLDTIAKVPDRAEAYFGAGNAYLHLGKNDEGAEELRKAVQLSPADPTFLNNYAGVLTLQGHYAQSAAQYEAALRIDAGNGWTWCNYGCALWKAGRVDEARRVFAQSQRLLGENAMVHENLAIMLHGIGHLEESLPEFARAVALQPDNPGFRAIYAENLMSAGRLQEAVEQCSAVLRLDPGNAQAGLDQGLLFTMQGRPEQAIPLLQRALAVPSLAPRAELGLGKASESLGRFEDAAVHYGRALELNADTGPALEAQAAVLLRLHRDAQAEAVLRAWLRAVPGSASAHGQLGGLLHAQGRHAEALAEFEAVHRLDPGSVRACNDLGRELVALGRPAEAVDVFSAAVRLAPGKGSLHALLADTLLRVDRPREAVDEFKTAVGLGTDSAALRNNLGLGLERMGRYDQAIEQFETALRLEPGLEYARANLARAEALRSGAPVLP